ncbi:BTAD domain-containing putative transcriptional regulator [Streptomyces sp. NPDC021056]|uniref:AfsR/SARP family transcriptional regulator n=1 Tax=Streptomyces sp. NPDC021056 TaxID=3155012 RepID=UPI0033E9410E
MNPSPSPPHTNLQLLGQFRLEFNSEPVPLCGNAQRLMAFIGLRRGVCRSEVAQTLWPDATETHARGSLRTALWYLSNNSHELELVHCTRESLTLGHGVRVDAHTMARTALDIVRDSGPLYADPLLIGLLDRGDLLPEWDDNWVVLEREWLRRLRLQALDTLAERLARHNMPALAVEAALASIRIEPLRENPHRAAVSAHLAEGNMIEALKHYEAFRHLLRTELGAAPSPWFTRTLPLKRR